MTHRYYPLSGLSGATPAFALLALLGGCGGGDTRSSVECVADSDCRTGVCIDRVCVAAANGGASAGAGGADEDRGGEGGEAPAPAGDAGDAGDAAVGSGGSGGGAALLGGSGGTEPTDTGGAGGDPVLALGGAGAAGAAGGDLASGAGGAPPAGGASSAGGSGATPGAGGTPTGGAPGAGGSGAEGGAGGAAVDVCTAGVENYCICQTEIGAGPCTPDLMVTMQMACRDDETTSRGQPYRDILACHVDNLDSGGQVSCTDAGICMLSVPSRDAGGGGAGGAGGAGPGGAGGASTGDCETCLASLCSAPVNACALDPACAAMVECIGACADDDCRAQCMVDNIAGLTLFEAVLNCSLDSCAVCG